MPQQRRKQSSGTGSGLSWPTFTSFIKFSSISRVLSMYRVQINSGWGRTIHWYHCILWKPNHINVKILSNHGYPWHSPVFLFYFSFLISFCLFNRLLLVCIIKFVSNAQVNTTDKSDLRIQIRLCMCIYICQNNLVHMYFFYVRPRTLVYTNACPKLFIANH